MTETKQVACVLAYGAVVLGAVVPETGGREFLFDDDAHAVDDTLAHTHNVSCRQLCIIKLKGKMNHTWGSILVQSAHVHGRACELRILIFVQVKRVWEFDRVRFCFRHINDYVRVSYESEEPSSLAGKQFGCVHTHNGANLAF